MRVDRGYRLFTYITQVLTGEAPFRKIRQTELGFSVVQGVRPDKPENAVAIGFSGSLWRFVQHCWDSDRDLRPRVAEVVTRLGKAAKDWDGLMAPCVVVESVPSDSKEPLSDSMQHRKFAFPTSLDFIH